METLDGGAGKIRTDTLIHHTIETGNRTTTLRSDMPDFEVDRIVPHVRSALDGSVVSLQPGEFSLEIDPDGTSPRRTMRYTMHHPRIGPMRVKVTPPNRDGAPARLDVSVAELLDRVATGDINPEAFMAAGDLERRIAWAWLSICDYSR